MARTHRGRALAGRRHRVDLHDPVESIGTILRDATEAAAVHAVVTAVCGVSDRQGATASDAAWYGDQAWAADTRAAMT